ncbi:YdaS family helix-turn-helix protein [Pseudomonas aeruginosa]
MNLIKEAVLLAGGTSKAAKACGVSPRAVNKWVRNGRLPRTEHSGETNHAQRLSEASGGSFSAAELLRLLKASVHGEEVTRLGTDGSALNVPIQASSAEVAQ